MRVIPFSALAILAACGGSGTESVTVDPISAAGFAKADQDFDVPYDFRIRDNMRIIEEDGVFNQVESAVIRIQGTPGSEEITVTFDGKSYDLERPDEDSETAFYIEDNFAIYLTLILDETDYAVAVELFVIDDELLDTGSFVMGYDTDPADIARLSGKSTFDGNLSVALRNTSGDAFGFGDVTFSVNFSDNTISGDGVLVDSNSDGAEFGFDPVSINFDRTQIEANGFEGTVSVGAGDIDGTLTDSAYKGNFFGPDADALGGQFSGRITQDDSDQDTFVDGVFLATQ